MQHPLQSISRSHKMRFRAEARNGGARFKIWAPKFKSIFESRFAVQLTTCKTQDLLDNWKA